jgi:hypothetical protein
MHNGPKSPAAPDSPGTSVRAGSSSNELLTADEVIDRLLEDANLRRIAATLSAEAVKRDQRGTDRLRQVPE